MQHVAHPGLTVSHLLTHARAPRAAPLTSVHGVGASSGHGAGGHCPALTSLQTQVSIHLLIRLFFVLVVLFILLAVLCWFKILLR